MKLTNVVRDSLTIEVLRHRFSDEIEAHIANKTVFAGDVYCDVFRKQDRDKIDALPAGWLPEVPYIGVQFGESGHCYESVSFAGSVNSPLSKLRKKVEKHPDVAQYKRVPEKHHRGCAKVYAADHRLAVRYQTLKSAEKDLQSRITSAETQIKAALDSVTTLPGLLKAWPEIEPFTKRYFVAPARLPAIPVSALNEMFKLPIKKAA